jgi:hypothetical protein
VAAEAVVEEAPTAVQKDLVGQETEVSWASLDGLGLAAIFQEVAVGDAAAAGAASDATKAAAATAPRLKVIDLCMEASRWAHRDPDAAPRRLRPASTDGVAPTFRRPFTAAGEH